MKSDEPKRSVTPAHAARLKRPVYFWSSRAGAYIEVTGLRRWGKNWQVTLADGRDFAIDPGHHLWRR